MNDETKLQRCARCEHEQQCYSYGLQPGILWICGECRRLICLEWHQRKQDFIELTFAQR